MEMGDEMKKMKRVMVTFDVDGTLIKSTGNSSNRLHRQAFSHAFYQVFGLKDASIDAIQHHGQTDPLILVNTLVHYGIPSDVASERLPDLKAKMIEYAKKHSQNIGEGLEVLPGVSSLLDALSSNGVAIGLVTGNLEEIAWMKMEGLGIQRYFTVPNFGGFGTDHTERGELIKIAANRANKLYPEGFDLRAHVGDTPNDIRAAENGGALAVGVCTGVFMAEELHKLRAVQTLRQELRRPQLCLASHCAYNHYSLSASVRKKKIQKTFLWPLLGSPMAPLVPGRQSLEAWEGRQLELK